MVPSWCAAWLRCPASAVLIAGAVALQCAALLTFHTILLGVLLPVLLACCADPLPPPPAAARQRPARQPGGQPGLVQRAAQAVAAAVDGMDAALRAACTGATWSAATLLAGWLLVGNSWLLAKALARGWPSVGSAPLQPAR